MADFRKWIIVLFALTLVAGLGMAQTIPGSGSGMVCNFTQTPTLPIRSESLTDSTADIIIGCTGGQSIAQGQPIPQANIQVTLNAAVTSRLIADGDKTSGASEALLLIDEPGANLPILGLGLGANAPQILCSHAGSGCTGTVASATTTYPVTGLPAGTTIPVASAGTPNVYQGVVSGNTVTFYGVPVLPPGTNNIQRTFRITNLRVNAPGIAAGSFGVNPVYANVQSNNALPLSTPTATVGFVQASLNTYLTGLTGTTAPLYQTYLQCVGNKVSSTGTAATVLNYKELFGSAFKTRVVPLANTAYAAQATNGTPPSGGVTQPQGNTAGFSTYNSLQSGQSVPGGLYQSNPVNTNSESDFIFPVSGACTGSTISGCAGLADFGTRFKAVFSNIPTGVSLYVSIANTTAPAVPGGTASTSYAQLVSSELSPEVNSAPIGNVSFGGIGNVVQLPVVNGSATAVWEVINSNQSALDTFSFPVYTAFAANGVTAPAAASVVMSYAPTPNGGANFSATGAAAAQGYGYPIPRFVDPTAAPLPFLAIGICQTTLLWPYVVTGVTSNGFDTGLAVSNTTTDPFGTTPQNGSCNLYFYGQNYNGSGAVASATTTPIIYGCDQAQANAASCVGIGTTKVIGSGQTWATLASSLQSPGTGNYWVGYVIGTCNFQDAHGYAAITDVGVRNIISSYLALVIQGASGGQLFRGPATAYETLTH